MNVFSIDEKTVDIIQLKAVQTGSAISPFYAMYIPDIAGLITVVVLIGIVLYWLLFGPITKMLANSNKIAKQIKELYQIDVFSHDIMSQSFEGQFKKDVYMARKANNHHDGDDEDDYG